MRPDGAAGDVEAVYRRLEAVSCARGRTSFHWVCALILAVEFAERICFYTYAGSQEFFLEQIGYSVGQSAGINSAFSSLCYLWPLLGGYLADTRWGRSDTIVAFASVYICGSLVCSLAALPGRARSGPAYMIGSMGLLALGTGGIKPNISNFGADQYDVTSVEGRRAQEAFYTQFYVAINAGALIAYGCLTTLCSDGGPFVPRPLGYFAAYGLATAAMGLAVLGFVACRPWCVRKPPRGDALRGVALHLLAASRRGSRRAAAVCLGAPMVLAGVLLTLLAAFASGSLATALALACIAAGLLLIGWGCYGDLGWIMLSPRNRYIRREHAADFLRIMPTLLAISMVFNALYSAMTFWYQEQACQMDLRVGESRQLNGSFFNVTDCIAIIVLTPFVLSVLNPALERLLGGFRRNGKLLFGCLLAVISVLWAARIEVVRRAAPLLTEQSRCAPPGVPMSECPAWWMAGPYALMGLAEVYVNPTLYYLSYSQTPLRLRSTAQAVCMFMSAVSSGLFTVLTKLVPSANNLNDTRLEIGYYASVALALPPLCCYLWVQKGLLEKDFEEAGPSRQDGPDSEGEEEEEPSGALRQVAFLRAGFFQDFPSPASPGGSPGASSAGSSPPGSPDASPRKGYAQAGGAVGNEAAFTMSGLPA